MWWRCCSIPIRRSTSDPATPGLAPGLSFSALVAVEAQARLARLLGAVHGLVGQGQYQGKQASPVNQVAPTAAVAVTPARAAGPDNSLHFGYALRSGAVAMSVAPSANLYIAR